MMHGLAEIRKFTMLRIYRNLFIDYNILHIFT